LNPKRIIVGNNLEHFVVENVVTMNNGNYLNDILLKALIIDDETDICYLLSRLLKHKNLDPSFVNSLSEADKVLKSDHPEIIFLDNHLPDGLGINYISYIKKNYPKSKIVMMTAHDSGDDRAKALKNGADYFIGKPFTSDIIYKTVDALAN
jgi:DNA-binding response OmpR family regulator